MGLTLVGNLENSVILTIEEEDLVSVECGLKLKKILDNLTYEN